MKQLLCFILLAAMPAFAQKATTHHYDILKKSNWFALSGGIANTPTPEAHALAALCKQTNAAAQFQRLLKEEGSAQQLYGLLGLEILKAPEFKSALPTLLKSEAKVQVLIGCIAGEREVAELAREIQNNQWRLPTEPTPKLYYAPANPARKKSGQTE